MLVWKSHNVKLHNPRVTTSHWLVEDISHCQVAEWTRFTNFWVLKFSDILVCVVSCKFQNFEFLYPITLSNTRAATAYWLIAITILMLKFWSFNNNKLIIFGVWGLHLGLCEIPKLMTFYRPSHQMINWENKARSIDLFCSLIYYHHPLFYLLCTQRRCTPLTPLARIFWIWRYLVWTKWIGCASRPLCDLIYYMWL